MSKEQAEEPVLWFRPRISLSGTVIIPSNKSFKKFYESYSSPKLNKIDDEPSKKSAEVSEKKSEVHKVPVMPPEKPSQSDTPQVFKKKRGRKPKNFDKSLEVSSTKPEVKPAALNSDQGKKNCEVLDSGTRKNKVKFDSNKKSAANGIHNSEAIVVIDDDVEPTKAISKNKAPGKANGKGSQDAGVSETSKKNSESQKAGKHQLENVKEQEKGSDGLSSSVMHKKLIEGEKITARPELPKKSKANESLSMSCPDPNCLKIFSDHGELIDHIKENHLLQCKMPFCSFTTFTFQEYCEHFEEVHCANTILPNKRGPRVAEKEPLPCKQAKVKS